MSESQRDAPPVRTRKTSIMSGSDQSGGPPQVPSLGPAYSRRMSTFGMGRRMSTYRRQSIASYKTDSSSRAPPVKLQPTYRMEPKDEEKFNASRAKTILYKLLESYLTGETYDATGSARLAKNLTDVIRSRMRELHLPRYKFVCHVMVGQDANQGMQSVSRCIWNTNTDNFASASYQNGKLYATASVFACYYE